MNHFWIKVLCKEANLLMLNRFIWCIFQSRSIQAPLNTFAYPVWVIWITSARSSSCSNLGCRLKGMAPTPRAVTLRSQRMWPEASLTSVGLGTLGVYFKSLWSLSHSRNAHLLVWAMAFVHCDGSEPRGCSRPMHSWPHDLEPSCLPNKWVFGITYSITTLWRACKCHTKLYLVV